MNEEVICIKDLNNCGIKYVLEIFTKSLRAFFKFKIYGLGIIFQGCNTSQRAINENHWVKTTWPLLAAKVFSLELFDTVELVDGILPALLNATQQLKVLTIHNLKYSAKDELNTIKKLESLEELTLNNFQTDNIDNSKLLKVIPKQLKKLCLKSVWNSQLIYEDIINILNYCSFNIESLELINIDVSLELMESITSINMKLKIFRLILADTFHYDHEPEIFMPLFKTKWPLVDLTVVADCLTYEHFNIILDTFKSLKKLSVPASSLISNRAN